MDTAPEVDSLPELDVTSELTIPKIEVTSEIVKATSKNDVETETMAEAMSEKNCVDDVSTVDTTSEVHVMSNADVASNKIDVVSTASDITVPPRGLRRKSYADQRGRRHSIATLNRSVSKHKFQRDFAEAKNDAAVSSIDVLVSHDNFCGNIRRRHGENSRESSEKSRIQQASAAEEPPEVKGIEGVFVQTTSEITEETSSAVEIEKSTLEGASAMIGVQKTRDAEGLSGIKKRKAKSSLGSSLKRKVDLIERILEDQVERIWEENVEKHTWLQPIETWITDRKSPSNYTLTHQLTDAPDGFNSTDVKQNAIPEPTYDFKFTPATEENEEPKIEIGLMKGRQTAKTDESKIENKIIEHWQRLRNRSPKSDRFEPTSSSTQLNKQEIVSAHVVNEKESLNVLNGSDVLEVKEIKRHDLLDRLKDNVKEKLEDIYRVEQQKQFFIF